MAWNSRNWFFPSSGSRGLKPRCPQGVSRGFRGESISCLFQFLVAAGLPWTHHCNLSSVLTSPSSFCVCLMSVCLPLTRTPVMVFRAHLDHSGCSLHLKILNWTPSVKIFLLNKVTFMSSRNENLISLGHHSSPYIWKWSVPLRSCFKLCSVGPEQWLTSGSFCPTIEAKPSAVVGGEGAIMDDEVRTGCRGWQKKRQKESACQPGTAYPDSYIREGYIYILSSHCIFVSLWFCSLTGIQLI